MSPDVVTVAVSRADGGITILRVIQREYDVEGKVRKQYDVTPGYVESIIAQYVNDRHWVGPVAPVRWEFVPNDYVDLNTDRTFRNAWKHGPGQPDVDMPKAREIQRNRLRRMRAPLLEQLDTEYMRADEAGNQQEKLRIAQRKQALRDVTIDPRIDAAKTPEELKAVIPAVLVQ